MTREQKEKALAFLKDMQECTYDGIEEIRTIIECLEQQPNEDSVSRYAILNKIKEVCFSEDWLQFRVDNGSNGQRDFLINYIEQLPPVAPTQKWIPVNEKLPKEGETVLVCYQAQGGIAQSVCEWFDMPNRGIVWSTLCGRTPIAWMPLPEPYKAEMESENKKNCNNCTHHTDADEIHGITPCGSCGVEKKNFEQKTEMESEE